MDTKHAVALGVCFVTLWVQYEQGMRPSIPKALQTLRAPGSGSRAIAGVVELSGGGSRMLAAAWYVCMRLLGCSREQEE
jgi:hypothetical protein